MISGIILAVGLIVALMTFLGGQKTIIQKDRWGDDREIVNKPLLFKSLGILIVTLLVAVIQPFAIEKVDSGYKGLKVNLVGSQRGEPFIAWCRWP